MALPYEATATTSLPNSMPQFAISTGDELKSFIQLTLSARNLINRDVFSKSDPVCALYIKEFGSNKFIEVGWTEVVMNNLNPDWDKKFQLEYRFEERQVLKFMIYDRDSDSNHLKSHDLLGSVECSLGEIVSAQNKKFIKDLKIPFGFGNKLSTIQVVADEIGKSKEVLHVRMCGRKLDKKDFFGLSDPFVIIKKQLDDGTWSNVYKTEFIKNTLNPNWKAFKINLSVLIGENPNRKVKFEAYDWNSSGKNDFIGSFEITFSHLLEDFKNGLKFHALINEAKKIKKNYQNSGILNFEHLKVDGEKSFLDYIQSGVQLHFTVAVDFTASNGDPKHPQSLHYRHPNVENQYTLAIKSVGEIIEDYDSDKLFPAIGFGAKLNSNAPVSHEFYMNGNPSNPFCQGVEGILEAYHNTLKNVQLFGPTNFAPVINHVLKMAASYQDGKNYFVLLIITDGIICDLDATKDAIINASFYPMSIIIVGVGEEDFSTMKFLDSDDQLLKNDGRVAFRDIVQFVELRKFVKLNNQRDNQQHGSCSKASLAKSVLEELPDQLVLWMGANNFT